MTLPPQTRLSTHEVANQPLPRGDLDLLETDAPLRAAIVANGADPALVVAQARHLGKAATREAGRQANRRLPELQAFDSGGRRLDEVALAPEYHGFMQSGLAAGYAALPWDGTPGGQVAHGALVYLHSQVEPGTCCPMTMTCAAVPALEAAPDLAGRWRPKLLARRHDPRVMPVAGKSAATIGMAMTEKQGGSDLRACATRAEPAAGAWRLTGHKWFCSAPMSDAFLTLAQTEAGLTCFLVPRWLDEGRNGIRLMRLKEKCGNRSNASAEIEYEGAWAERIGPEGQGIRTILPMVHQTRLDTALAPAGLMRAAVAEALHWSRGRRVFQRRLADQPLMAVVLADLALDQMGALALGLRVARAYDSPAPEERAFARLAVALAKFLANKIAVPVIAEAMEVLGGMGYVEDTVLPLLYREAPLNGIWEGSGNVIALDAIRTLAKEPLAGESLRADLAAAKGAHPAYDAALAALPAAAPEAAAREVAEKLATLLTAAELFRTAPQAVADGYAAGRLGTGARIHGSRPDLPAESILARFAEG